MQQLTGIRFNFKTKKYESAKKFIDDLKKERERNDKKSV